MSPKSLKNKVIIVTGASGGIGTETSRLLTSFGASCVLASRRSRRFTALIDEIKLSNSATISVEADLALWQSWPHLVSRTVETFGRIDALVHCVGSLVPQSLESTKEKQIAQILNANLLSTMYAIKAVLPVMRKQKNGDIVVVGSLGGLIPMPFQSLYCATKFGVRGLCLSLNEELRGTGISVSVIAPGPVRTRMLIAEANDRRATMAFSNPPLEPVVVADKIADILLSPTPETILPRHYGIPARLVGLFPRLFSGIRPLLTYFGARRIRVFRKLFRSANTLLAETE